MNKINDSKKSAKSRKLNRYLKFTFNKKLVTVFIITLAIPLTVTLSTQTQNLQKLASEPAEPISMGYIVEFKDDSASSRLRTPGKSINQVEEEINLQHRAAKKNIMSVLGVGSLVKTSTVNAQSPGPVSTDSIQVLGEYQYGFNGIALNINESQAQKLLNESPYVKAVYKNLEVKAQLMDTVPMIGVNNVWQIVKDARGRLVTGKGVNVAVIDTGVDYRHPDLGGSQSQGVFNAKVVGGKDIYNEDSDPMDDNGHGTHVAGIIAANGSLKGVAPDAKIYAYKVLNENGKGYYSGVQAAVDDVIKTLSDSDSSNDIDIINLSVGGYCGSYSTDCGPDNSLSQHIDEASRRGIAVVISAGNDGTSTNAINVPGVARSAITVGSIDKSKNISAFSSRGPVNYNGEIINKPDIVAPGDSICSSRITTDTNSETCFDSLHYIKSGTSQAAPMIAGFAALIKQKNLDFKSTQIKDQIIQKATNLGFGREAQGSGLIEAKNIFDITPVQLVTLNAIQDAYVDLNLPSKNFGPVGRLKTDGNPKNITYIKFDLSSLAGKKITKANLKLNVAKVTGAGSDKKFNIRKLDPNEWQEGKVNYKNKPNLGNIIASFTGKGAGGVINVEIKDFVSANLGNSVSFGIVSDGANDLILLSKEASSGKPRLVIEYQ